MTIRILVVDDEVDLEFLILQKFKKKIQEGEFQFVFSKSAEDALDSLEAGLAVDIVLTDINMPGMDGLALLSQLNERAPFLKTVVVSAYGDIENIRKAMNLGAFDFLTKPIDFKDMELTIRKTYTYIQQLRENINARLEAEKKWHQEEAVRTSLEEMNRLKNEFIGFMTHELRTPLNTVLANVSFLEISMEDAEFLEEEGLTQMDLIKRIKQGGEVLLQLIKSSLDLQKIETGKIHLNIQTHDMVSLIQEIVNNFEMLARQKGLLIHFEADCEECLLMCDKNYFLQVLRNLIGNAIQFTKEGHVKVMVYDKGDDMEIIVTDTGCGIPTEDIERIFNPFEQVHRKQQEQQGTGLGLAYCKEMVTLHHGKILVDSIIDQGSTFTLQMPKQFVEE